MKSTIKTHVGWVRQVNEDAGTVIRLDENTMLVIIADGMGGHKAGEVASQMAIEIIGYEIQSNWNNGEWQEILLNAVEKANQQIYHHAKHNPEQEGMGTTIEVGLLSAKEGLLAHVGDSRVYLYHENELKQLTDDHTLVYALYKNGQITMEEAQKHPQKNMILRALGTEEEVEIDLIPFSWNIGDRILFCTDGFSNHVGLGRIKQDLEKASVSVHEIGERLLKTALELGGDDNITFVLVENGLTPSEGGIGV
jgi:serine/threonine protein phosphatase PrpC